MTNMKQLYRRRSRYTLLGILSLITPFPGIGLGCLIQAKCVDNDIKEEAFRLEMEAEK